MKARWFLINCLVSFWGLGPGGNLTLYGEEKTSLLPDMQGKSCVDSDCHASIIDGKPILHGPVAHGKCGSCHEQLKQGEHVFTLAQPEETLCGSCHILSLKNFIHEPVEQGRCLDCHDPHGSEFRYHLRQDPAKELCLDCHQDEPFLNKKYLHHPVSQGQCILCHEPHSSWKPKLLIKENSEMCLFCHEDVKQRVDNARHSHPPAKDNCVACHNPHGSDQPMQLRDTQGSVCLTCHTQIAELIENSDVVHGALMTDSGCANCHSGHASTLPKLLKKPLMDICLGCHNKAIEVDGGKSLTNMATLLRDNPDHHGPVKRADCSACHNPHAASNFRLLAKEYPQSFYAPFDLGNYDLCFQCHISDMVTDKRGIGLTQFRNGELNLHFVHVNKEKKGRTCRACHEVHASKNPLHIRESVPFGSGGWEYQINYQQTETGGSCAPGCHEEQKYDRENTKQLTTQYLEN